MYWYMRESINFNITFSSAETNDGNKNGRNFFV